MRVQLAPHIILLIFTNIFTVSFQQKSSLTYVIDNTGSMQDDILQVQQNTDSITEIVLDEKFSQIQNMVLVTFNDPHAALEIVTSDRNEFKRNISKIIAYNPFGNKDCEEPSMNGILLGLQNSLPGSFIYVFTDASSKDYLRSREVTNLCQQKQSQIIFILTGHCRSRGFMHPGFQVYYDIATACSGLAFYVPKYEVNKVLRPIKDWLTGNKTVITRRTAPARTYTNIPFIIDDQTEYATVTVSGIDVSLEILGPKAIQERSMWVNNAKVIKLINPTPGIYAARVKSSTETAVYVVGRTDFLFSHGFSPLEPKSLNDTTPQPIANAGTHVSIAVTDPKHTVKIKSLQILDMNEKVLQTLPLKRVENDFYTTPLFVAPSKRFKIAVNGKSVRNNKYIRRIAKIPITPQDPPKALSQKPVIIISEGRITEVEYGNTIKLTCKISAYPEPKITWKNSQGVTLPSQSVTVKLPYDHISYLTISDASKSDTYTCQAENKEGAESSTIKLNVKEPFEVKSTPKGETEFQYGEPGTLTCDIRASVPMHIYWTYEDAKGTSKQLVPSDKYEISSDGKQLSIKKIDLDVVGKYACKAVLDENPNKMLTYNTEVKIAGLVPPNLVDKIDNTKTTSKGADVVLECHVTGVPKPIISWKFMAKDSTEFVSVPGSDDVLRLSNVDANNAGRYKCIARNALGEVEHDTTLEVNVPPNVVDKIDKSETASKGSDVVIKCHVTGIPKPSITWKFMAKDSTEFVSVPGSDDVLRLSNVDANDAGRYKCIARNVLGKAEQDTNLDVLVPPNLVDKMNETKTASKGSNVVIECHVTGVPKPIISWKFMAKDSSEFVSVPGSDNVLRILNVDANDAGRYKCITRNALGEVEYGTNLDVHVPPTVVDNIKKINNTKTTSKGSDVVIECHVTGVPKPIISWKFMAKDSSEFVSVPGSGDVLRLSNVDAKDAGRYKCIARNALGVVEDDTILDVHVPPTVVDNINKINNTETTSKGSDVIIECHVTGIPKPIISWKFMAKDSSEFVSVPGSDNMLRISNVDANDAGRYKCIARNALGEVEDDTILDVHVPPTVVDNIKKINNTKTTSKGSDVVIECHVTGVPKPMISWKFMAKDSSEFVSVPGSDNVLRISNVDANDAGRYKCIARNALGEVEHDTNLDVHVPPTVVDNINKINNTKTTSKGSDVVIECHVTGVPKPIISWKFMAKDSSEFVSVPGSGDVLRISNVDANDAGRYKCIARNALGEVEDDTILDVHVPPTVVDNIKKINNTKTTSKGSDVVIECHVTGVPKPIISWKFMAKDSSEFVSVPGSDDVLRISNVDANDAGRYKCIARNALGEVEDDTILDVHVPPTVVDNIKKINNTKTTSKGSDVVIECHVTGVPKPIISWKFMAKDFSEFVSVPGSGDVLRLSNVDAKDAGRYKCIARNALGEVEDDTILDVHVPPNIVDIIDKTETASKGSDIIIKCHVTGVPKPIITWKFMAKDSSEFVSVPGSGDVLRISNVDANDAGRYKCIAHNALGEVEHDTTLDVHVPPKISITDTIYKVIEDVDAQLKIPCVATGLPKPVITWKVNGDTISQSAKYSTEEGTLIIKNPTVSDSHTYRCEATNAAGTVGTTFQVNVIQAPQVSGATTKNAKIGSNLNLECKIVKGVPKPTITWQFMAEDSSKYVSLPDTGDVLVILGVQVKHAGRYKCIAHNDIGNVEHITTLNVRAPPKIMPNTSTYKAIEGRDIQLKIPCTTIGMPKPAITWIMNGQKIIQSAKYSIENGDLIIKNPKVSDSQMYMCEASNEAGSVYAMFRATIQQAPQIIGVNEMTIPSGFAVQIVCNIVKGVPAPTITWQFMGKNDRNFAAMPATGRVLHLSRVDKNYAGHYKCIARNDADAAEHVTTLTVEFAPIITSMTNVTYEALEGDMVLRIPCETEGEPKPIIKWKIGSATIIPSARVSIIDGALVIRDPKESDTNSFTCEAKNDIGTARATFVAEVHTVLDDPDKSIEVNVLKGTSKKLECGSDDPKQKVRWFKEGEEINTKHKYIDLTNVNYYHTGNYSCRVSDMNGAYTVKYYVVVGTPPVFTFERESPLFDWNGGNGENDILDCGVDNPVPSTDVVWTYNGEVLKGEHSLHLSVNGNWGHYTCNVSNVHGAIQRSFDVISTQCFIKRRSKDEYTKPLILSQFLTWPSLESTEDFLEIAPHQPITFACPSRQGVRNNFKKIPSVNKIKATCLNQDIFEVNGKSYKVSDLGCAREIDAIVNREHIRCSTETSELIRVGYNIPGFLETYEVCFDTAKNIPLYARVVMSKSNRGRSVTSIWYRYPGISIGEREYTCVNASSSCCYSKAQLVNARDVSDGPPQRSTYIDPLNAIPYWRPCDGKDPLDSIENIIRSQLDTYPQFVAWSGIHTLQTINGLTIPRYLWKVLKFDKEDSIAMVYVNHPSPSPADILCKNICFDDNVTWLKDLDKRHIYCCNVDEFIRAFGLRDTSIGESMDSTTRPRKH